MHFIKKKNKKEHNVQYKKTLVSDYNLSKVDPEFRKTVDFLFFTDRSDIDLSLFKDLLKSNYNFQYFEDRFNKSCEIFWDTNFWYNRIKLLLLTNNKRVIKLLSNKIEKNFLLSITSKLKLDHKNDNKFIQYIEYCKVKKDYDINLSSSINNFINICSNADAKKSLILCKLIVPILFNSYDDYIKYLLLNNKLNSVNLNPINLLIKDGADLNLNLINDFALSLLPNYKSARERRILFTLLTFNGVIEFLQQKIDDNNRSLLLRNIMSSLYEDISENHFFRIKSLLRLDPTLIDDISVIFLEKVYTRYTYHKKSNIDKICKFIKTFPEASNKKILSWLSLNGKNKDIKYLMKVYPELNKLALFV
jgi:hypothetical protein